MNFGERQVEEALSRAVSAARRRMTLGIRQRQVEGFGTLSTFRKAAIQQLVKRPLSKWQSSFWKRFDEASV